MANAASYSDKREKHLPVLNPDGHDGRQEGFLMDG
jgi:hypothetical protein